MAWTKSLKNKKTACEINRLTENVKHIITCGRDIWSETLS